MCETPSKMQKHNIVKIDKRVFEIVGRRVQPPHPHELLDVSNTRIG